MHPTTHADTLAQLNAELAQARESRAYYDRVSSEAKDMSYEQTSPQAKDAWMGHAMRYRAQAVAYGRRVHELVTEIAAMEKGSRPVEVTVEAAHDQDDTFNYQAASA